MQIKFSNEFIKTGMERMQHMKLSGDSGHYSAYHLTRWMVMDRAPKN